MSTAFSRRSFIQSTTVASAGVCLGSHVANAASADKKIAEMVEKAVVDWPVWDSTEEAALLDVLNSGTWGRTTGGRRMLPFETAFAERMKARFCIATSSGTTALLSTLGGLGIGPGDEVILPPYTFVATFNVITSSYALPMFVDSDLQTFQIDPTKIQSAITPSTKLLLPVHIGGSPADMDAINAIAKAGNLTVIEDACQAPLAEWRGKPVGTTGLAGCISFQSSKNLNCGEGGAILTNDENFANLCYNFHTPGGGKPAASSGRGSNFRLTEFQASLLLSQMARLEEQSKMRDANAAYLTKLLQEIPGISPAKLTDGCTRSAWHLYMLRYDKSQFAGLPRAAFLKELGRLGVSASSGYTSLNKTPHVKALASNPHYIRIYGEKKMADWVERNQCPVNDRLCEEAVWFIQTTLLKPRSEMDRIADAFRDIQKRASEIARAE